MKDRAYLLFNTVPVFAMLTADFLLTVALVGTNIDKELCMYAAAFVLLSFLVNGLFGSKHFLLRFFTRLLFFAASIYLAGYLLKDLVLPLLDLVKAVWPHVTEIDFDEAYHFLMYFDYENYLFEIVLASYLVFTQLIDFKKERYFMLVFISCLSCFLVCFTLSNGFDLNILSVTILLCTLYIVFSKNLYTGKNKSILSQWISICVLAGAVGLSFLFYPKLEPIKTPAVLPEGVLDELDLDIFNTGASSGVPYVFDEYIAVISNDPFDASDKTVALKYNSDEYISRFTTLVFDYYDPEQTAFIVTDLEDQGLDVGKEKHEANRAISTYHSRAINSMYYEKSTAFTGRVKISSYRDDSILSFPYGMDMAFYTSDYDVTAYEDKVIVMNTGNASKWASLRTKKYTIDLNSERLYQQIGNLTNTNYLYSSGRPLYSGTNSQYYNYDIIEYVQVPAELKSGIKEFVDSHGLSRSGGDLSVIEKVEKIFANEYKYTNTPKKIRGEADPVLYFLNHSHEGYSRHFAAAKTLVYRYLGIPARFVLGYLAGDSEGSVTSGDEYAWCEVLLGFNWTATDDMRTPGSDTQSAALDNTGEEFVEEVKKNNEEEAKEEKETEEGEKEEEKPQEENTESSENNAEEQQTETQETEQNDPNGSEEIPSEEGEEQGKGDEEYTFGTVPNGTISNEPDSFDAFLSEPKLCLIFKSTEDDIDRLRQYAFGDFDYQNSAFCYDEDIRDLPKLNYNKLFLRDDKEYLDQSITVNSYISTNAVFRPYSDIYGKKFKAYYDRAVTTDKELEAYTISYHAMDESQHFDDEEYRNFVYEKYLKVPAELEQPLKDYLYSHGIDWESEDKEGIIVAIKRLFGSRYYYSRTDIPKLPEGKNVIMFFLNESKTGKCTHYASSATLLFRVCGIPARYVTGFMVSGYDIESGYGLCLSTEAHAWTERYVDGRGWVYEEMTLGAGDAPQSVNEMPAEEVEIEIPEETADGQDTEDLEFEDPGVTETIKKAKLKKILISAGSVMLAALMVIGLRAIYIKGKKKLSPHQRINLLAEPLEKENSLSEESYALLEKLHYSKAIAEQIDEETIRSNYEDMLSSLKEDHKMFKILGIKISVLMNGYKEMLFKKH